jgi:hypothetical protein
VDSIWVHETYNPGALVKVTAFNSAGEEVLAWEGEDPTPRDRPKGISVIPVNLDFEFARIKLYINSPAVPGWNEIDAVALADAGGEKHWATSVECSTTYAQPAALPTAASRGWAPEQVVGEPDSPGAGDATTAWASAQQDDQQEWLVCQFASAVEVVDVLVHENFNPGAVFKITAFDSAGEEQLAWEGADPTPRDQPRGVSVFPVKVGFPVSKIKVYIDSPAVPGWNEIDAVGLRDEGGAITWASQAEASSSYADYIGQPVVDPQAARIEELTRENEALRQEIEKLKAMLDEQTDK